MQTQRAHAHAFEQGGRSRSHKGFGLELSHVPMHLLSSRPGLHLPSLLQGCFKRPLVFISLGDLSGLKYPCSSPVCLLSNQCGCKIALKFQAGTFLHSFTPKPPHHPHTPTLSPASSSLPLANLLAAARPPGQGQKVTGTSGWVHSLGLASRTEARAESPVPRLVPCLLCS